MAALFFYRVHSMSKYSIYRIDHHDPSAIGKKRKRISILIAVGTVVYVPILLGIKKIFKLEAGEANLIATVFIYSALFLVYRKIRSANKKFPVIGEVEFTRTGIRKRIGDSSAFINYESIKCIELKQHIPAIAIGESKSGYFSYIMTIEYTDSHTENLIVSDLPVDKKLDVGITDTVKTINKLTSTEIRIH
jgi:hypothetical protein